MSDLNELAMLIKARNDTDNAIAKLIGRPALIGHLGEYIASQVFGIKLEDSASNKSIDGSFIGGPLAGRTVNVKWYGKEEGMLDVTLQSLPDHYLVFTGPRAVSLTARGATRPLVIERVFLFDANRLVEALRERGVKLGVATSVAQRFWEEAEIYPARRNGNLLLSDKQRELLALFR